MKKQFLRCICYFLLLAASKSNAQEIHFFDGNMQQAQEEASRTGKPLMVYLRADWCGYCLYTEKVVFTSDTAYTFYNENYICLKIQEKTPDFRKLNSMYHPEVLPAYLFFNSQGKFITMSDGFQCATALKKVGERAQRGKKKFSGF